LIILIGCLVEEYYSIIVKGSQKYILLGTTYSNCGPAVLDTYTNFTDALILALNKVNEKGGVTVNGTNYLYDFIQYPDGFDTTILKVTYAYLTNVENVDFFIGPYYSLSPAASALAENLHRLIILTEYPADDVLNTAPSNYTLSISPSLKAYASTCLTSVQRSLIDNDKSPNVTVFLVYDIDSYVPAQEIKNTAIAQNGLQSVGELYYNSSISYEEIASIIRAANPDIVIGGGVGDLPEFIPAIRKEIGLSHGSWDPVLISFDIGYPNNPWYLEGLLYPQTWTPLLPPSQQDIYFGTAMNFTTTFTDFTGRPPLFGEAAAAAAVLTIQYLINQTQSFDGAVLTAYAKTGVKISDTFFGEISFNDISIARSYICIQNVQLQQVVVAPPALSSGIVNLNPLITYPKDFFSTPSSNTTLRDALLGTLVPIFTLVLLVLFFVLVILKKYHLIFIPKKDKF